MDTNITQQPLSNRELYEKYKGLVADEILRDYDLCFAELTKISQSLSSDNITLEEMMQLAQKSVPLARACRMRLNKARAGIDDLLVELQNIDK